MRTVDLSPFTDILTTLRVDNAFKNQVATNADKRLTAFEDALRAADMEVKAKAERQRQEEENLRQAAAEKERQRREAAIREEKEKPPMIKDNHSPVITSDNI